MSSIIFPSSLCHRSLIETLEGQGNNCRTEIAHFRSGALAKLSFMIKIVRHTGFPPFVPCKKTHTFYSCYFMIPTGSDPVSDDKHTSGDCHDSFRVLSPGMRGYSRKIRMHVYVCRKCVVFGVDKRQPEIRLRSQATQMVTQIKTD